MSSFLRVVYAAVLFTACAFSQTFGSITGEVKDSSGAVVGAAAVTLINPSNNATRTSTTNDEGLYTFPSLPPGTYNVRIEKQGFKSSARAGVELQVQETARVDFNLEVGNVKDVVEVTGDATLLSTETVTVGTVIETKRIVDLPLNGRNFLQLVSLAPNVSFGFPQAGQAGSRQGGDRANQNISIAGARSQFNRFTLDGVENTDANFNTYIILPSVDALQEFKVQTGVYPAEFGRGIGQINVSTKPGTNEFHGTAFEFLRNKTLDATQYAFTTNRPKKDPFNWNQYGFTLGGPIWIPKVFNGRNRLFFLSNYEGFKQRRQNQSVYDLPSAPMRAGDFSGISTPIYDPLTSRANPNFNPALPASATNPSVLRDQFPGNIIPTNRLNPVSLKLLEFYPAPNVPGGALRANFVQGQSNPIDKDQFNQRIDWNESQKSQWFGRYGRAEETNLSEGLRFNGSQVYTRASQWMISNVRTFTPTVVNEFRFGYNRFFNNLGRQLAGVRDVVKELGIPGLPLLSPESWGIPSVTIAGFSGFGDDSEGPYVNNNQVFQWTDNMNLIRGKHSFRFGADIRNDRFNQIGNQFARGSFTFENQATQNPAVPNSGYAFADYLLGNIRRPEVAVALANAQLRAVGQAYYVDDTWRVRPNLTFNLGLRYEFTPPWYDKHQTMISVSIPYFDNTPQVADKSRVPVFVRIGTGDPYEGTVLRFPDITLVRDGRLGERLVKSDKNDFAPRLGLSWNPSAKWTLRTGVGMFYSQDAGNPRFDMNRNLSGRLRDEANADFPNRTWQAPFANPPGTSAVNITTPYAFALNPDRRTPYTIQYLLNLQREVMKDTVLEVGYLGSVSHRLESLRAVNEALPGAAGTVSSRQPYPTFGRIQFVDNGGNANYHSLGSKLTRRFSSGLTYLASYTYSKSIDNASSIRSQNNDTLFPQNSYCVSCERAVSAFDVKHRFVMSTLYDLPVGKGRMLLNRGGIVNGVIGGWQVGGIWTWQSGFPINVFVGRDQSNTGAGFDRPNTTGQSISVDNLTPNRAFNTGAFSLPAFGSFGNAGRNSIRAPHLFDIDFTALKNINFTERQFLQFRFEAFNATNHPNWGNPNTTFTSSGFGTITSTRTAMRQLQLALKYVF